MIERQEYFRRIANRIAGASSLCFVVVICLFAECAVLAVRSATANLSEATSAANYSEQISRNYDFKFGANPCLRWANGVKPVLLPGAHFNGGRCLGRNKVRSCSHEIALAVTELAAAVIRHWAIFTMPRTLRIPIGGKRIQTSAAPEA